MKNNQIVVIDVGSSNVVIAVGAVEEDGRVNICDIVSEPVSGVNAGRIENSDMVGQAIAAAKRRVEANLGIRITEAYAGLAGDFIRCVQLTDHVYVKDELRNGSNQITQSDIDELDRRMKSVKVPDDHEMIMTMEPLRYKVDEREVDIPVGAYGHRLSATYNFILCDKVMRNRLNDCLAGYGIAVKEFVPSAFVSHLSVATTEDMQDGAVIVNLGGGVTDVTVLYGGKVRHMASIPIGMSAINSDIRAWSIPTSYVEDLKVQYGSAVTDRAVDDIIVFPSKRVGMPKSILRKNLVTIIEARIAEIVELVGREIKDAGCGSKFMPIVLLTGGGSQTRDIEALFSRVLGYEDVRAVYPEYGFVEESMLEHINTPAYATVASLLIYGAQHGQCSVAQGVRRQEPSPIVPAEEQPQQPIRRRGIADNSESEMPESSQEPETSKISEQNTSHMENNGEDVSFDPNGGKRVKKVPKWKTKMGDLWNKVNNAFVQGEDESDF